MKRYSNLTREERIQKVMSQRREELCLVLENLSEDINISAILRTAESFGVGRICIVHPRGKKPQIKKGTTSGAHKWLNIRYYLSIKRCFSQLKKAGFTLIGALVDPEAKILWSQDFPKKVAVVLGNEAHGMSKVAQKLVDINIYLPMFGLTESLNVSVATGIFIYEVIRQKENR